MVLAGCADTRGSRASWQTIDACRAIGYKCDMSIQTFRDRRLKRLFEDDDAKGLNPEWAGKLKNMLQAIDSASEVEEVGKYPGWRLHPMKGEWKGFWSLTVSGNWRLFFRFENGDAFDLLLHDPH
jgi:proteic killer suppression protein